ncbi:MAG: CoA transferase [Pseudomonadota bacterium]
MVRKPLDGIRVLDLTRIISGPYCTRLLADCGAEVIKVEPVGGEHMRQKQPMRAGHSTYFGHLNAGKKSVVIDFRDPSDLARIRALAKTCDIAVENFRPGVVTELGLDYPSLAQVRPDIIYCSISGFGQDGPRATSPAYAPILHALSGHDLAAQTYDGALGPAKSGIWYADIMGGAYAYAAIQTALVGRLRYGTGQFIDVSLLDTMINLLVLEVQEAQTPSAFSRWLATPVQAADGHAMAIPITGRNFERLADAIDRPALKDDPRFNTQLAREENWQALMCEIQVWTKSRPAAEVEAHLMAAGVPCSRYQTVAQAIDDPQIAARGLMSTVGAGEDSYRVPGAPFLFADTQLSVGPDVPATGADTEAILGVLQASQAAG